MKCNVCHHGCELSENQIGFCGVRENQDGKIVSTNYGLLTALALDPIEKKPLAMFHPGSKILSIGSFGCNLACPFCQNFSISKEFAALQIVCADERSLRVDVEHFTPEELLQKAIELKPRGNIGIAFTYNEPLVSWEFVRDTSKLFHEHGLKNVIVTNGSVNPEILDKILPYTDAMNIDLKAFNSESYKKLGGDLETVKNTIKICAEKTHVELTTLIVPDFNDSPDEMREEAKWISGAAEKSCEKNIPLHVTRFFPRYKMESAKPTAVKTVYKLAEIAREYLTSVFVGNC